MGVLLEDKEEARKLRYKVARYTMYDDSLYKRGFNQPLLRCIAYDECEYITREVHEGIHGKHEGGTSLAQKILRQGYYWSSLKIDAYKFARACNHCQRYANFITNPAVELRPIVSP